MSDFQVTKTIKKTRSPHRCEHCETEIAPGASAIHVSGVYEGDFYCSYEHPECHEAGMAYARMTSSWGDEWIWLHQLEETIDFIWLLKNHPAAAVRLNCEERMAADERTLRRLLDRCSTPSTETIQ